ncbi:MAG TPA: adenylyl-sulfate kinase [Burkholderiales bacterium]|nr:adenylyl-sulfate kinase [Burkholderiales bacterium]
MPDLLRFITCGNTGDGKSTLIDRVVIEAKQIFEPRPSAVGNNSPQAEGRFDFGVLPCRLQRVQETSIDGVDRVFSTVSRRFVTADTPADDQETRSTTIGAFNAELGVILVDACKGVLVQTRRQSRILALFGVNHIVLAVNKMDMVGWDRSRIEAISTEYRAFADGLGFSSVAVIPLSALTGANVATHAGEMPWYGGPSLLGYLDTVRVRDISSLGEPVQSSDQFEARLLWIGEHPMVAGRRYIVKIHTQEVSGSVSAIRYRLDFDTGSHLAARRLCSDEIGVVNVSLDHPGPFTPHAENPRLGAFVLIDNATHQTVGAGMIDFALRRAANLHWQQLSVDKEARSLLKHQTPRCIWLTGLSGSGKSTIANLLEKQLHGEGLHTCLLDGDNVRHGLNRDLGFTEADRVENLRRIAEVAKLMVEAGLIVIVSFISPFRAERGFARSLFAEGEFIEVYIDTPLEECERRDPKGLYAKARAGRLANFTGIDSPYEHPENPEVGLKTTGRSPVECAEALRAALRRIREPGTAA